MRIVIDFFKLIKGEGKSIGIYNVAFFVIENLAKLCENESDIDIIVICNQYNKNDFQGLGVELVEVKNLNPKNKLHCLFWELFGVNKELKRVNADVVLFPRGFIPFACATKSIALIHDMIPFYYNENYKNYFNRIENFYIMNRLKYSARYSNHIITVSNASKNEIIKYSNVENNKITVIYNGIEQIDNLSINGDVKENVQSEYICAITSKLPHKNAIGIIKSYEQYCTIVEKPLDLIVIGINKDDIEYCKEIPMDVLNRIKFRKYIKSNDELYSVINNSKLFLFLSLVEGFGLPPIEAMQLGVPVICSNCSSLPEVTGGASILVDPNNYIAIAGSIKDCLNDSALQNEMSVHGKLNADRFAWSNQAKYYLNTMKQIVKYSKVEI